MTRKYEIVPASPDSPENVAPCSLPIAEALGGAATGYVAPAVVAMGDAAPDTLGPFQNGDPDDPPRTGAWGAVGIMDPTRLTSQ